MVASREGSTTTTTTTVGFPCPSLNLLSQKSGTLNVKIPEKQMLLEDNVNQAASKEHWDDLSALLQGTVKCRKEKPPSTKQTKKEAFDHYMNIIYGLPPNNEIYLEDTFPPGTLSFYHEPNDSEPHDLPPLEEEVHPGPEVMIPMAVKKKKLQEKKKTPAPSSEPENQLKVKPRPVERVLSKTEEPPEVRPPVEQPKAKTPAPPSPRSPPPHPCPRPRTPTPLPPREPTPEVPTFLKQFAESSWFRDLFPDKTSLPRSLSPEAFSLQLLSCLTSCSDSSKLQIFAALQTLHSQKLLQNTDQLHHRLIDLVPTFSHLEKTVLVKMLNLLMHLKLVSYEIVKTLLTLLAFKSLGLWETLVCMLTALGIDEAEQWLWPELDTWDLDLQDQANMWESLHDRAERWLQLWSSKYKKHNRYQHLTSTAKSEPLSFSTVDVLNYFCSIQKEEYRKTQHVAPSGHHNTVLLPLIDQSQAIFRLGETYSMTRIRKPAGIILPPLRNRPFLTHFPHFISFPLSRITLRPFHISSDAEWQKASPRRYFIQQQSYVEYYR